MKLLLSVVVVGLLLATGPGLASAQIANIDYVGFGWEDGGLPPSDPGDELIFTGVANYADPVYGVDLSAIEVTFYVYDLVSTGQVGVGGGTLQVGYTGGTLEIWGDPAKNADWGVFPPNATAPSTFADGTLQIGYTGGTLEIWGDPAKNADWGVFPPNATAPSTFADGTLLFRGTFLNFTLFLTAGGSGAYEGSLDGVAGDFISGICADCAYTWGGAFTEDVGAQIPDGYDVQIDGQFELDQAVATHETGWGRLKSLYGN